MNIYRQNCLNRFSATISKWLLQLTVSLFCLLPLSAYAQTGPGGVSTDLELWFKANSGAESDGSGTAATNGSAVQIWQNQAADHPNYDGDQTSTPGDRPTYSTSAAEAINGNPVLVFNGNNHYFPIRDLVYSVGVPPNAITVYSVLTTNNAAEGIILSYDRNQYFRFATDHDNDGGFGLSTTGNGDVIDDFNASPNGIEADGVPHILGGRFDPLDIVDANKFLFFDGTVNDSTNAGTSFGNQTAPNTNDRFGFIGVGSEADMFDGTQGPTNYLEGNLAEVIYFDRALTPAERQQVESYLAIKYGITLSGDTDGNGVAFETGGTVEEGDYVDANGLAVWDASANLTYHNNIAALANDTDADLVQLSSQNVDASSILNISDAGLINGDYIIIGSNAGTLGSSALTPTAFERVLNRVWKAQITGSVTDLDNITIDLSSAGVLPDSDADIALVIDNNDTFSTPTVLTTANGLTFIGDVLSVPNVDLSGGDVFFSVAFNLKAPGGIVTAPAFWFRADAGAQEATNDPAENGDGVALWLDQSGNGFNGDQTDATERPTYNSATPINFNPVISFDGSNSELPIRDLNYDLTTNTLSELTVFSVVKSNQADEGIILSFDRSSFFRFALNHNGSNNFGLSTNVGTNIDDNNATSFDAENGLANLVAADFNAGTDDKNLYFNGNSQNLPTPHGATGIMGDSDGDEIPRFGYIGTGSEATTFNGSGSPGEILNGDLAELIFYETALVAADRLRIESYLALKYGLTLPDDYESSAGVTVWDATINAGYQNGIAGLGIDDETDLSQLQSRSESEFSVLTIIDDATDFSDGEFVVWGHDGDSTDFTTTNTGTRDVRINREWKFETTGTITSLNTVQVDLSHLLIPPSDDLNDYRLLLDNTIDFSSIEDEITPDSFVDGVLTFSNVDVNTNIYMTLGIDPDLDRDGIADADDIDEDNDGIPNVEEGNGAVDTDGDGIVDSRDLDSDNDGIGDLYESGMEADADVVDFAGIAALDDTPEDGRIDIGEVVGTDGFLDILQVGNVDLGALDYTISNSDGAPDLVLDFRDLDTDNNGLSDLVESGQPSTLDTDDNGVFDSGIDVDRDGISDEIDTNSGELGSARLAPRDLDGDGIPDFRDLDNDEDGTFDVVEIALTDDGSGRLDLTSAADADGDGAWTTDLRDSDDGAFGSIDLASLQDGSGTDWYSYKSGDWDDWENWTQDPSGTLRVNPGMEFPNIINEDVTILNGDVMLLDFNNVVLSSLTINNGGILNTGNTTNHNFGTISGRGTVRLSTDDFPGGDATDFASSDGGTVEYIDQGVVSDYELTTPRTFNNMVINTANTSTRVVLKADYTLNGDLEIASGVLQINDDTGDAFIDNTTPLRLLVNGNMTIESSGVIATGNVDASTLVPNSNGVFTFHELEILGDFTNDGSVDFENLDEGTTVTNGVYRDAYPTAADLDNIGGNTIDPLEFGVVEVLFTNGTENQLITLNGHTDFYRVEIAKGISQTFIAEFNASTVANFRLLGRIAMRMSDDSDDTPNIENHRALGLETGILKLGNNIVIDQIAKEDTNGANPTTQGGNRNYIIDIDAQLWLSSNASVTKSHDWGIHPFGKLKITDDAILDFTGTGQRTILIDNQGVYEQSGGTVNVTQYRNKTGADDTPRGSFVMTGGTLNIGEGGADGNHAIFSVPWADQNFILQAADLANPPEINITLDANRGKDDAVIQIGVNDGNYIVGESTINIIHTSDTDYKLSSTAPLYNLTYESSGAGRILLEDIIDADDDPPSSGILPNATTGNIPSPAQFKQPLVLLNDLIINEGRFVANDTTVTIQNRLTIEDGGEYEPGNNTTIFNGSSITQRIRLNGTDPLVGGFNNLTLSSPGTSKEFEGTLATVIVQGDLTIESDAIVNDNGKVIQVNGNVFNSGGHITDVAAPGRIELTGGAGTHQIGGDGTGQFKILTLNDVNGAQFTADQTVDSVLNLVTGLLDIDIRKLTINSAVSDPIVDDNVGDGATNNFDATRMIMTAGNASDGGIEMFIDASSTYTYPFGTTGKYTPAGADVSLTNGNTGFIQIRPVDRELATIEDNADENLNYYWRVGYSDFGNTDLPNVDRYVFIYDAGDVSGGSADDDFVAGSVLDSIPYTRSYEGDNGIQVNADTILFDGLPLDSDSTGLRAGFVIEKANYTAGAKSKFIDAPNIYYTKGRDRSGTQPLWTTNSTWTRSDQMGFDPLNPHSSTNPDSPDTPSSDDVVVIGFFPFDDPVADYRGYPHSARLNVGNAEAALLIFTQMTDDMGNAPVASLPISNIGGSNDFQFRPTLTWNSTGSILIDEMRGEGTIRVRGGSTNNNQRDPSLANTDLVDFARTDSSTLLYEAFNDYTITNIPAEVPTLQLTSDGFGGNDRTVTINSDFITNQNLKIQGNANLVLGDTEGDVTILGDLILEPLSNDTGGGELRFQNTGTVRMVNISGNILIGNTTGDPSTGGSVVRVETGGTVAHLIDLDGSIIINTTGNNTQVAGNGLIFGDGTESTIDLTVKSDMSSSLSVVSGNDPELHRLIINKGSSQSTSFTINSNVSLTGPTSGTTKAVELENGTLILNNSGLNLELSSGGADFNIPSTAGLEIQDGVARVTATGTGLGNGIRLDGKITLSGGDLVLDGDPAADNYIEYGTGGSSEIEINNVNSELVVGSQFRRNPISDDGVITYTQTAGTAIFGANLAPDDNRGVFEIYNANNASSFTLTGASTRFAIVNGQANPAQGTFILNNGSGTLATLFDNLASIEFGFNAAVAGTTYQNDLNETYEINSDLAIPNIVIDSVGFNDPILEMIIQPLTVTNDLRILNGGTLASNDLTLTVNSGFTNDGTYTPGNNTTIFNGTDQSILGTTETVFNNLDINPTNDVTLGNNITVNGDLNILTGLLDDDGNRISLLGDLNITTEHVSDGSPAGGIAMENPTDPQEINLPDLEAEIDHLIINNTEGVFINANAAVEVVLTIDDTLALDDGILSIADNRLILDESANVTTSSMFSANRMISVNGVKKSDGVDKQFPITASPGSGPFEIPVGTPGKYTPVILDVDEAATVGNILVKPINEPHPSATGPDVLNYYWVVSSADVTNFEGSISFTYVEEDANEAGQNEDDNLGLGWINKAARLIAPNWSKPSSDLVDTVNNVITFTRSDLTSNPALTSFNGEFTVGNEIPDQLLIYRSNTSSALWDTPSHWDVDDGMGFVTAIDKPQPGSQVIIRSSDVVTMVDNIDDNQNIFSVDIDGILDVGESDGHNFGDVSGNGTLRISNATLPGGNYDNFFNTGAGSIDLSGSNSYTIAPDFTAVAGLIVSGSGTKTLPSFALSIGADGITIDGATLDNNTWDNSLSIINGGDITINSGTFDAGSGNISGDDLTLTTGTYTALGGDLDLAGSLTIDGGTFNAGSGDINIGGDLTYTGGTYNNNNGKIVLDGTGTQTISGDFAATTLQDLEVNKPSGNVELAANATVYVSNLLELRGGLINTLNTGVTLRLLNGSGSYVRTSGYIDGPLQVNLNNNVNSFRFPIGKGGEYKPMILSIPIGAQPVNPVTWEVEYYDASAATYSSAENSGINMSNIQTNPETEEQVDNVNTLEFWRIDTQGATAVARDITLDISNLPISQDNISDQELQVVFWNDATKEWDHLGGVASGTPSTGNVIADSLLSFSEKIVTTASESSDVVLPVEMLYFTGEDDKGVVDLDWATATEIDNDYFEIQRSQDGRDWEVIGVITGAGSTVEEQRYSFSDFRPYVGNSYYRLRQVDYDGKYAFTDIILVNVRLEAISFNVYPNPVRDVFTLDINGINANEETIYSIISLQGSFVSQGMLQADQAGRISEQLSLSYGQPSGIYILRVETSQRVFKFNLIKR